MTKSRPTETDDESTRSRNREKTTNELKLAIHRLQRAGKKITIKVVADEAKVSAALIHNRYPDIAEEIRSIQGKATRAQRDEKHDLLQKEREKNRKLREEVSSLLGEIRKFASVNEALRAELALQKAIADGKVTKGQFGNPETK